MARQPDKESQFIDIAELRIGLFIYLDVGWLGHPFALNSFKVTTQDQIATIRTLGLERIRYSAELSDPEPQAASGDHTDAASTETFAPVANMATQLPTRELPPEAPPQPAGNETASPPPDEMAVAEASDQATSVATHEAAPAQPAAPCSIEAARQQRRERLAAQRQSLQRCENQFSDATRSFRHIFEAASAQPAAARAQSEAMVGSLLGQIAGQQESYVRLLAEKSGERTSLHSITVTIISLLLGKALGLDAAQLESIGLGALLHDIGKASLPDRLRWVDDQGSPSERQLVREHIAHGVALVRKMGLSPEIEAIVAQHHEHTDGSGYPKKLTGEQIGVGARVVALVNHYDNLCNPGNPARAITPHEAMALIYAQARAQFDPRTLAMFIRMMGVYPPGSVIELTDGRFALVVSVNSSRPLRPQIIVHDPAIPSAEALILDLETEPKLGIHRSLKPVQLPRASYDYLSPRRRLHYFFERPAEPGLE